MAALLVALAIMAILLTIAMPVWRHEARREKEAELVFRGEQYARAIALFKFKNANIPNAMPPSIDFLVQNRFLRKKYKDPMTKDGEFVLIGGGSTAGLASTPADRAPASLGGPQPGRRRGRSNTPPQPQPDVPSARHDRRSQQERGNLDPLVPRRDAIRPVAVHVQHRAAPRRRHADGQPPDGRGNANPNPFGPGGGNPGGRNPRSGGPGAVKQPRAAAARAARRRPATPPAGPRGAGTAGRPGGRGRGF